MIRATIDIDEYCSVGNVTCGVSNLVNFGNDFDATWNW